MTQKVKLINKKKFMAAVLDTNSKNIIVYIVVLDIGVINIAIHPFQEAQIRLLKANKAFTTVSNKYFNYTNVYLLKLITKLLKYTNINKYAIEQKKR